MNNIKLYRQIRKFTDATGQNVDDFIGNIETSQCIRAKNADLSNIDFSFLNSLPPLASYQLRTIVLQNCNIRHWPDLYLRNIVQLDLRCNDIIHEPMLPPSQIESLCLAGNKITGIPFGWECIRYVDVSYNRIEKVEAEFCSSSSLRISGNPLRSFNIRDSYIAYIYAIDIPTDIHIECGSAVVYDGKGNPKWVNDSIRRASLWTTVSGS